MTAPVPPVPDEPGPGALRATESLPASDDTGYASPAPLGRAQRRAGAVPALPPGAVFDREAVRGRISAVIRDAWWSPEGPASEKVMAVVWPLLEHAQDAAAGSQEGIRLWMLDCGELVARHRERANGLESKLWEREQKVHELAAQAERAEARLAELEDAISWHTSCTSCARTLDASVAEYERAERAEAKLAEVIAYCTEDGTTEDAENILALIDPAILGSEGGDSRG